MNRLYVVESRFSLTGAMADHRLRYPASQIAPLTFTLAEKIFAGTNDAALGSVIGSVQGLTAFGEATFDQEWINGLANDLMAKPGASLVLAGPSQPGCSAIARVCDECGPQKSWPDIGCSPNAAQSANNRYFSTRS